jgi:adenosylmethionine-8-amino-7-oxononanoate aminotransferase
MIKGDKMSRQIQATSRLQIAKVADSKVFGVVHGAVAPDTICDHGEGVYLFDENNKRYIDFSGGPHVACIGHGDQRITQAVIEQMKKVSYFFHGLWLNEQLGQLAERIISLPPPDLNLTRCQLVNSGSEATETAIKLAHQYHLEKGNPEKFMVIGRWQGYHGMTLGALSASGTTARRRKFSQLLFQWPKIPAPLCYHCPYGLTYPSCHIQCALALEETINQVGPQYISAFIAESIGGSATAGMVPVPEYYPIIRETCNKHDILFIDDEVICGFGRTGKWFGIEHWGVSPDIMTFAKGMTAGYTTMAGLLIGDNIREVFEEKKAAFVHGFTMEANPVSCAVAMTVIDILEKEDLVAQSAKLGEYLHRRAREKLSRHPSVGDIRGKGMLLGVELVSDREAKEPFDSAVTASYRVYQLAKQRGCMVYPGGGLIQGIKGDHFLASPPFIITEKEIDTALDILDEAITEFEKEVGLV